MRTIEIAGCGCWQWAYNAADLRAWRWGDLCRNEISKISYLLGPLWFELDFHLVFHSSVVHQKDKRVGGRGGGLISGHGSSPNRENNDGSKLDWISVKRGVKQCIILLFPNVVIVFSYQTDIRVAGWVNSKEEDLNSLSSLLSLNFKVYFYVKWYIESSPFSWI